MYIVMTATAKMPASCWGNYRKAAIVELEPGFDGEPKMISERARGVKRIVELRSALHVGKTDRCEYSRALAEMRAECVRLNVRATEEPKGAS